MLSRDFIEACEIDALMERTLEKLLTPEQKQRLLLLQQEKELRTELARVLPEHFGSEFD